MQRSFFSLIIRISPYPPVRPMNIYDIGGATGEMIVELYRFCLMFIPVYRKIHGVCYAYGKSWFAET